MVITQGDIFWADLPEPVGSEPGFRRPAVVVQGNLFNSSELATVVCVPLTGNLRLARLPGNTLLASRRTGLPRPSVANASQIFAADRSRLTERIGRVSRIELQLIFDGIDTVLGRRRPGLLAAPNP